jgi:hypothetical protein
MSVLRFVLVLAFVVLLLATTATSAVADGWPSCCR